MNSSSTKLVKYTIENWKTIQSSVEPKVSLSKTDDIENKKFEV